MAINATQVPRFAGKDELSLQDLDKLAGAVQALRGGAEYVPAGTNRGRRQYGLANYNLGQLVDECAGEVAPAADKAGMVASVGCQHVVAPYIDNGNMVLPLAHSAWPAEYGGVSTPGFVVGVQYDDAGSGGVLPRVEAGIIHLRAETGGGGVDECPGGCNCSPAWYDDCEGTCVLGLIRSVGYDDALSEPRIDDGKIKLPVGLRGVLADGVPKTWAELECMGYVRLHAGGADSLPVSVSVSNGYLNIYVDRP